MPAIVKLTVEALAEAISLLDLEEKRQEILEQKIFEDEEADYEDDPATLAEIRAVEDEYPAGEYITYNE